MRAQNISQQSTYISISTDPPSKIIWISQANLCNSLPKSTSTIIGIMNCGMSGVYQAIHLTNMEGGLRPWIFPFLFLHIRPSLFY
uniref:Uncharacterized protein n=1 Tax=Octopus bimaculoides TaxID=37653 RepID=A0A0L8GIZ2_OCTBM